MTYQKAHKSIRCVRSGRSKNLVEIRKNVRRWQSFNTYAILKSLATEISPLLPEGHDLFLAFSTSIMRL